MGQDLGRSATATDGSVERSNIVKRAWGCWPCAMC
jgi:hypothetical protein